MAKTPATIARMNNMKHSRQAHIINAIAKSDKSFIQTTFMSKKFCDEVY